tara:strand:- start:17305 stop:17928 length:624 start_codon:yes stop_codon:yes gene_type:complete
MSKPVLVNHKVFDENEISIQSIKKQLIEITEQHKNIGKIETPKGLIKKRQGFDYVELSYMKNMANEQFPGWSWIIIKGEALGSNAYVVHGRLKWFDNGLWREGDMVAAHRIQTKRGESDTFVDIGNDIKSANTDCMKKALNVYMDIAADVYRSEDPNLDDQQHSTVMNRAQRVGGEMPDEIAKKLESREINSSNYKAAIAKLERIAG